MIDNSQIGLRIKRLREDDSRKWSPIDLAKKMGVNRESVRLYEKGSALTFQRIGELAAIFGVSEEFLIFGRTTAGLPPPTPAAVAAPGDYTTMVTVMQQVAALPVDKRAAIFALAGLDKPDAQLSDEHKQVLSIWDEIQQRDRAETIGLMERQRDLDVPRTWSVSVQPTGYTRNLMFTWDKDTDEWTEVPFTTNVDEVFENGQADTLGEGKSTNSLFTGKRQAKSRAR